MDHRTVAAVSLAGICLDVLGGLYLAYDLLGGRHGPLRLLTRMVTYSIVFGTGYALGLGLFFGITSGIATGVTIALELQRISEGREHYPWWWEAFFSAIRGVAFGAGLYGTVGLWFAATFALLITVGQIAAYSRGMRPGLDYSAALRPRLTRLHILGAFLRTLGYIVAALLCGTLVQHIDHIWPLALRIGVVTGVATTVGAAVNPFIEYYADNLPERQLGVFGIGLVLAGFSLQSFQYWLAILDVNVR